MQRLSLFQGVISMESSWLIHICIEFVTHVYIYSDEHLIQQLSLFQEVLVHVAGVIRMYGSWLIHICIFVTLSYKYRWSTCCSSCRSFEESLSTLQESFTCRVRDSFIYAWSSWLIYIYTVRSACCSSCRSFEESFSTLRTHSYAEFVTHLCVYRIRHSINAYSSWPFRKCPVMSTWCSSCRSFKESLPMLQDIYI